MGRLGQSGETSGAILWEWVGVGVFIRCRRRVGGREL